MEIPPFLPSLSVEIVAGDLWEREIEEMWNQGPSFFVLLLGLSATNRISKEKERGKGIGIPRAEDGTNTKSFDEIPRKEREREMADS